MKKIYLLLLFIVSIICTYCRNYEKPVLVSPNIIDTNIVFQCEMNGQNMSTKQISGFMSNSDSVVNIKASFSDKNNSTILVKVPFWGIPAIYQFTRNNQSTYNFFYMNNDSSNFSCGQSNPLFMNGNQYFANVQIDEIKNINNQTSISGTFNFSLYRQCNFTKDTIVVKNAIFKNILIN